METLEIQLPSKKWYGGNLELDRFSSTFYIISVTGKYNVNNELYCWLHLVTTHLLFSKAYSILPLDSPMACILTSSNLSSNFTSLISPSPTHTHTTTNTTTTTTTAPPLCCFSPNQLLPSNIQYMLLLYLVYFPFHPTRLYVPLKGKDICSLLYCQLLE